MILSLLIVSKKESEDLAKFIIKLVLEKGYKLPFKKVFKAWQDNAKTGEFVDNNGEKKILTEKESLGNLADVIMKNLSCINAVEAEEAGACKFLYENYGISNFGRFSAETWIEQYKEREKIGPYGLVVASRNDWNASSYSENAYETYDDLRKKVHPSHSLRIIESQTLPKLAKSLVRLKKKYQQMPDFVIWSGHSSNQEFFLGPNLYRRRNYKFFIGNDDFQGEASERIQPYLRMFPPNTIMILDSCSDGGTESLPAIAAKVIGNKFIYPKGKTSVEDFGVKRDMQGNLSFNVRYHFGINTMIVDGSGKEILKEVL